jgi:hypothetical protein
MAFLYSIPAGVLLFLVLGVTIALACWGQLFVHRHFDNRQFIAHNEVGGIIIAVSGTLYAVLLGFITVVAWQHYQDAREIVVAESNADIDVWHIAVGLPSPTRERLRTDMLRYAENMIQREWPTMRAGTWDPDAAMIGMDAIDAAGTMIPATSAQANAQLAVQQQLTIIHDARQQRITVNSGGITGFEWLVLGLGAMCIICFCWLFGLRNPRIQLLMTSTVVTIIVSTLVLLFELQHPFRSDVGVGADAWQRALNHIHQMEAGEQMNMRK